MPGVYQVDDLTSADQVVPDGLVQDSISGSDKTVIKSQFGDVRLSVSDSILALLPCLQLYCLAHSRYSINMYEMKYVECKTSVAVG